MTARQLTSQNATITTVEVKVSTLTVTGKQVTLAVFRQLREEPLIADDGTLNGVPWGYVNYCPDGKDCGSVWIRGGSYRQWDHGHRHVVWQRGSELLRSCVQTVDALPHVQRRGTGLGNWGIPWNRYSDEVKRRHAQVRETLADLPQLFIAV